jgi:glyoxylase-like metal-dependent hydrolase (beta-lactamase superfamily II)
MQYRSPHVCSAFFLNTKNTNVILDCGTSDDVSTLITYLQNQNISLKQITYLVPSHYHFDHFGGGWKLWELISDKNPEVKILTTELTKEYLQNPEPHMKRAVRTFGKSIGEMRYIPDKAFEIIEPNQDLYIPGLKEDRSFRLESTPGHTPDHVTATLSKNGETIFMFVGESAGSLMHDSELVTLGTSMPPEFNFDHYIASLEKIIDRKPVNIGLAHFGAVLGRSSATKLLNDNLRFTYFFRDFVNEKYHEKKKTRHIVEQFLEKELPNRVGLEHLESGIITNVIVALVYGQLIDLGLRKPK